MKGMKSWKIWRSLKQGIFRRSVSQRQTPPSRTINPLRLLTPATHISVGHYHYQMARTEWVIHSCCPRILIPYSATPSKALSQPRICSVIASADHVCCTVPVLQATRCTWRYWWPLYLLYSRICHFPDVVVERHPLARHR